MFNYQHLSIKDATSWLEMPEVAPNAKILLKPAAESNAGYYNAMLKLSAARIRQMARKGSAGAEEVAQSREEDRQLFPRHVIAGWEGIPDVEGNMAPFNLDNASKWVQALPDWLFDRIRNAAGSPERFTQSPPPNVKDLAGN